MSFVAHAHLPRTFGPARDQGQRPTCLAFAVSDTHASLRPGWVPLSCEYIFCCSQERERRSLNVGATFTGISVAIRDDGQPIESDCPYLPAPIPAWRSSLSIRDTYKASSIHCNVSFDAIIENISEDRPVIVGMMLSDSFYRPVDGIVIPNPIEPTKDPRRHAVIAVGHGTNGRERAIWIRNSWGPKWGNNGYAWLTEEYLKPRLFSLMTLGGYAYALSDRAAS